MSMWLSTTFVVGLGWVEDGLFQEWAMAGTGPLHPHLGEDPWESLNRGSFLELVHQHHYGSIEYKRVGFLLPPPQWGERCSILGRGW